jgi:drug/metabolite transporter (DMT)-like permease
MIRDDFPQHFSDRREPRTETRTTRVRWQAVHGIEALTGMDAWKIGFLVLYALGMATGQILFKIAANGTGGTARFIPALITNPPFWVAVVLYGALTVLWVWLLTQVPLVYAYPFAVLAFVFTPLLAHLVLHEGVGLGYLFGSALLVGGLLVITWTAPA